MIKTKTVKIAAIKAHTRAVKVDCCDFCDFKTENERMLKTCTLCKRHACWQLTNSCVKWDDTDFGDYPDSYCPPCNELRFVKYRDEFDRIEEEAWKKKDQLIEKIKQEREEV